jgi:ATP-binding cassette subfamily B protein
MFAAGYALSIAYVASLAASGRATTGDVLLIAVLATQVLNWVSQSAETIQFTLRTLTAVSRFLYLLDAARPPRHRLTGSAAPGELQRGIHVSGLSFRYDGQSNDVLSDLELDLPAGSTVALVGDNGAGKTTLVKLLAGYYEPTAGRILVDDLDLQAIDLEGWREPVSGVFQDYARIELVARESVGVGHLPDLERPEAAQAALQRADAEYLIDRWPAGLETQLGPTFPEGVDLSGGEWQKVALARGMMREAPLLLVLDEPTAALDPESEQELFERYASAARRVTATNGGITLLVSHRFSTVRMADIIAVLAGGRVIEFGTHAQLMAHQGYYAGLFSLQARAYN